MVHLRIYLDLAVSHFLLYLCFLQIFTSPVNAQRQREVTAILGNSIELPCIVDAIGDQQVIWKDPSSSILTINEQRITADNRFSIYRPYIKEWNLNIDHVRKQDQGTYTCIINNIPEQSTLVELTVNYPPSIVSSSDDVVTTTLSQDVTLFCNATGFPAPVVQWYKFNIGGDAEAVGSPSSQLVIKNVSRNDGGSYKCEATNGISPDDSKMIQLQVNFKPEVMIPHQKASQRVGSDTLLECVVSANPLSDHYWSRGGIPIQASSKYELHTWEIATYTRTLAVFIKNLEQNDFGDYTCVAENEFGVNQGTVTLFESTSGSVRVFQPPKDALVRVGQDVELPCTVEGLGHRDNLIWWKHTAKSGHQMIFMSHSSDGQEDKTLIDTEGDKYEIKGQYNLHIKDVVFDDSATYICEVQKIANYSAHLAVHDSLECNSSSVIEEGLTAEFSCSVNFVGEDADLRLEWQQGTEYRPGTRQNEAGALKNGLSFESQLNDAGSYKCVLSSSKFNLEEICSTSLIVTSLSGNSGSVVSEAGISMNVTMLLIIFGAGTLLMFIVFLTVLSAVIVNFRRQIREIKGNSNSSRSKNGHVGSDMEANKLMDQSEVEIMTSV